MLRSGVMVAVVGVTIVMCGRLGLLLECGEINVFRFGFDLFLFYPKEVRGVEWIVPGLGVYGWNDRNNLWDGVVNVVVIELD